MRSIFAVSLMMFLSACASMDMHGQDPRDYYAKHPIKSSSESKTVNYQLPLLANGKIEEEEVAHLREALNGVSPEAVESIRVQMKPTSYAQKPRRQEIKKAMKSLGYFQLIRYEPLEELSLTQALLEVKYSGVVLPDCPDWKMSPGHIYSNYAHTNFGCAQQVNLGLMVADPKDLDQGHGELKTNTERASKALSDYNAGVASSAAAPTTSSSTTP